MGNRDVEAVLVWDFDYLRRRQLTSRPVDRFMDAMSLRSYHVLQDVSSSDRSPISMAARGLAAEVTGDEEHATEMYNRLAGDRRPQVALLGRALRAWMPSSGEAELRDAAKRAGSVTASETRARLWCKLASIALDKGHLELADEYLSAALDLLPKGHRAHNQLGWIRMRLFGHEITVHHLPQRGQPWDAWVDLSLGGRASRSREEQLKATVQGPWRHTVRFGLGPREEIAAVEMQTVWAGLVWRVEEVRRQLATYLLAGNASARDAALGLAMWTLGRGSDLSEIADAVEPRLTRDHLETLLSVDLLGGDRWNVRGPYADLLVALWDVVPEHLLASGLDQPGVQPKVRQALWSCAGVRLPEEWGARIAGADEDDLKELFLSVSPYLASTADDRIAQRLLAGGAALVRDNQPLSSESWDALDILVDRFGGELPPNAELPTAVVARLASRASSLVDRGSMAAAAADLVARVEGLAAEARGGRISGFSVSPFESLARALSGLDVVDDRQILTSGVDALVRTASDVSMPPGYRLDALIALANLHEVRRELDVANRLLDFDANIRDLPFDLSGVTSPLLEIVVARLMADSEHAESIGSVVIRGTRHPDSRVRRMAIEAAAVGTLGEDVGSLISPGLWDPEPAVVTRALEVLPALEPGSRWTPIIAMRIEELQQIGTRSVREAAVAASRSLPEGSQQAVIARALQDRSWSVRQAAIEATSS